MYKHLHTQSCLMDREDLKKRETFITIHFNFPKKHLENADIQQTVHSKCVYVCPHMHLCVEGKENINNTC